MGQIIPAANLISKIITQYYLYHCYVHIIIIPPWSPTVTLADPLFPRWLFSAYAYIHIWCGSVFIIIYILYYLILSMLIFFNFHSINRLVHIVTTIVNYIIIILYIILYCIFMANYFNRIYSVPWQCEYMFFIFWFTTVRVLV